VKPRAKKRLEWTVATIQALYGGCGAVLGQLGVVGKGEPKLVLHLSWAALFFTGLVGLIAAASDG
jgi:hypothetical protein